MKKQEFKNMRRGLRTYGTTLNVPKGEEAEKENENLF